LLARGENATVFMLHSIFKEVLAEARRSVDKHMYPIEAILILAKIAGYSGDADDFAMAISLIPKIHDRCTRARAKKAIAVAYAKAGKIKEARDFASSIKNHFWRAETRVVIAEATGSPADLPTIEDEDFVGIGDDAKDEINAQIRALKRKWALK
ncbi:MAG: hypothetical protein AAB509_02245, partial [Patescibacteria group bacterium]